MSEKKNKLTIRCFFCNKIGDMTRDDGSIFSASIARVDDKFGCICINCLRRLYQINQQFMDQTADTPSRVGSIKSRVLAPRQTDLVVKKNSNPLDDIFPSFGTWQCLDNSLESYIKLVENRVFGQSEAVKRVVLALYNNQFCNMLEYLGIDDVPERDMVLLIGSTGVGKTFLAKTAAEAMGIPYVLIKAETLTATGWVGGNVESILEHLYYVADRDLEKAQTGIVIIDEIDKKNENQRFS